MEGSVEGLVLQLEAAPLERRRRRHFLLQPTDSSSERVSLRLLKSLNCFSSNTFFHTTILNTVYVSYHSKIFSAALSTLGQKEKPTQAFRCKSLMSAQGVVQEPKEPHHLLGKTILQTRV